MTKIRRIVTWIRGLLSRLRRRGKQETLFDMPEPRQPRFTQHRVGAFHHNMPGYQPCPAGHGWKSRRAKTRGGARYWCSKCGAAFFVRG